MTVADKFKEIFGENDIYYQNDGTISTSATYDIPVQEHEKQKTGICNYCIHKYVCKHYAIMMKYDYGYNHVLACSHYIKGKEVPGQMILEDSK